MHRKHAQLDRAPVSRASHAQITGLAAAQPAVRPPGCRPAGSRGRFGSEASDAQPVSLRRAVLPLPAWPAASLPGPSAGSLAASAALTVSG
jgi:hypothetical protein